MVTRTASDKTSSKAYKPSFSSAASALRTLRAGKRHPNWLDAAEYLLERAAPDVKLLIEAALDLETSKQGEARHALHPERPFKARPWYQKPAGPFSILQWCMMLVIGGIFTGLVIWIVNNAMIRQC